MFLIVMLSIAALVALGVVLVVVAVRGLRKIARSVWPH
jgi:hypothetical protein